MVTAKRPSQEQLESAFAVFGEDTLPACAAAAAAAPALVPALVKTVGARGQAPRMRAACANCLANLVIALGRAAAGVSGDGGAKAGTPDDGGAEACGDGAAAAERALETVLGEPDLLENLYRCLKAGNDLAAGLALAPPQAGPAAAAAEAGGSVPGGEEAAGRDEGAQMALDAARCVTVICRVSHGPAR